MNNNYNHKGLNLTPAIFSKLLVELFDGKQFDRNTAISTLTEHHISHGGIIKDKKNLVAVFKSATRNLKENGIQNVGYGIWRLNYKNKETIIVDSPKIVETKYTIDKEIGKGNNSVYLYYYDSYKELAKLKGLYSWQCKIGRTDTAPLQRIIGQTGTCFPEPPHVALLIHCDDSSQMEAALHSILKVKKRHIESAPGREWFMTSPEEIENLYNIIIENH